MKPVASAVLGTGTMVNTHAQQKLNTPVIKPVLVQKQKDNSSISQQAPSSATAFTDADYFHAVTKVSATGIGNWRKGKQTGPKEDINHNKPGNGPFIAPDTWRIEEAGVTLKCRDKTLERHPTRGAGTIHFANSNMYLNFKKWQLRYKTGLYFNPFTPFITNRSMN